MMRRSPASDMQNMIVALALSTLILFGWQYFIEAPRKKAQALTLKAQTQTQLHVQKEMEHEAATIVTHSRTDWLKESPRVQIRTSRLQGSFALKGLRFDDLSLVRYRQELAVNSPPVILFSPAADKDAYFAEFGWLVDAGSIKLPTPDTIWKASSDTLTATQPVTLTWDNGAGVIFTVKIALDDNYMFTVTQSAAETGGKPVALRSYAYINRVYNPKEHATVNILHEGPLGVFDNTLTESPYKKLVENGEKLFEANAGWLGVTDKYWLAAMVPPPQAFNGRFSYYQSHGRDHFQVDYSGAPQEKTELHFFAGAKELSLLDMYAERYHIPLFDRAVDFGILWFLAKPIFIMLEYFHALVGNFGIAILLLTVVVKLLMFPLANKSFAAMNRMKVLQPKMKDIQERCKDDKMKLNQEIMALYKREKVNPASGCLPMFIQIPVFFSLYKVLYVTLEMRQAPFYGWIHDLSAPDPTNLFTLFGLIAWNPPSLLHLGIWPLLMCATMVIQQHQSPPPPDPAQAKMMKFLPFIFLFMFSAVAAGLVIYWTWSNLLSILQQWYIKESHARKEIREK